ncbi:transposase domain-containing protein [Primorskyibacter aestuariivivens]|uniref:transposase domain-containing protein n=1 Tax=Primorskyibacter aestuariivivens TaxID=1888912 RepID=UPI002301C7E4|nr:transposase domain-containing protein [Primorskyibacter aestuariivivens]MDA7428867.1 transposase domain-containing protein [Primorskyibacter aestuariivivens]
MRQGHETALSVSTEILMTKPWAMLASLVATCKLAGVNPVDYLAYTLRVILDGHCKFRIEDLTPWRYARPSSRAA